jgi:hypothetical protein
MASQASTPSATSDHTTASLDLALGLPDEDLQHEADKHLSKKWAKLLSSAKLTLDQKSTAAALNVILCLGRSHRHLAYVLDQLLASGVGHDDSRRVADEALAVAVEAEREPQKSGVGSAGRSAESGGGCEKGCGCGGGGQ